MEVLQEGDAIVDNPQDIDRITQKLGHGSSPETMLRTRLFRFNGFDHREEEVDHVFANSAAPAGNAVVLDDPKVNKFNR